MSQINKNFIQMIVVLVIGLVTMAYLVVVIKDNIVEEEVKITEETKIPEVMTPCGNNCFEYKGIYYNSVPYEEIEKQREERKEEGERIRIQFEENKKKWLEENPPVDFLFDTHRKYDKDYIIFYLQQFPISGDCALVWIYDVICWDNNGLVFPTERPDY